MQTSLDFWGYGTSRRTRTPISINFSYVREHVLTENAYLATHIGLGATWDQFKRTSLDNLGTYIGLGCNMGINIGQLTVKLVSFTLYVDT